MKDIVRNEIKKLKIFQEVPESSIQTLLNQAQVVEYGKKEVVYRAKEAVGSVYIILGGEAVIYNITKHGNRKVIFILGKGSLLNYNIISRSQASVFCEAVSELTVLKIPQSLFVKMMEQEPAWMCAVMREYERYIWRLSHQLKNTTGNMYLERKIAAKLWKLGRDFGVQTSLGVKIDVEMTMNLMADLVGAPRENVSRACKNLSSQNLIVYKNKHFWIPDPEELSSFYKA
jgi:CRP/FNR family cyclic AMP-dependent transcriptional regulator